MAMAANIVDTHGHGLNYCGFLWSLQLLVSTLVDTHGYGR